MLEFSYSYKCPRYLKYLTGCPSLSVSCQFYVPWYSTISHCAYLFMCMHILIRLYPSIKYKMKTARKKHLTINQWINESSSVILSLECLIGDYANAFSSPQAHPDGNSSHEALFFWMWTTCHSISIYSSPDLIQA